jgi:hypothetical protein
MGPTGVGNSVERRTLGRIASPSREFGAAVPFNDDATETCVISAAEVSGPGEGRPAPRTATVGQLADAARPDAATNAVVIVSKSPSCPERFNGGGVIVSSVAAETIAKASNPDPGKTSATAVADE